MISVPVYSDENGIPQISIYVEDEDGTFRRTQSEPLRLLRDDIQGISIVQGDMVSSAYDRQERNWQTPTVTFHYGRPQSFYQFLRDKIVHNRFFVFTKPQLSGHISKFSLHELKLKNSTSQRKVAILKEKYIEALRLWPEEELEAFQAANSKTASQSVETTHRHPPVRPAAKQQQPLPIRGKPTPREHSPRGGDGQARVGEVSPDSSLRRAGGQGSHNDTTQRKNRIQEFSLAKPRQRPASKSKEHNKHFYNRFIFTID